MVSPDEIRTVTFERTMRGYRCEDVNEYLQQVAQALADRENELEDMNRKLLVLAQKVEEYRREEDTLKTAMINAQRMGEKIIQEAKQKAEEIIREANIRSEDREQHAQEEVARATEELEQLHQEVGNFKSTVLSLYTQHIKSLNTIPSFEQPGPVAAARPAQEQEEPPEQPTPRHNTREFDVEEEPPSTVNFAEFEAEDEFLPAPEDEGAEEPAPEGGDYGIPASLDGYKGISFDD